MQKLASTIFILLVGHAGISSAQSWPPAPGESTRSGSSQPSVGDSIGSSTSTTTSPSQSETVGSTPSTGIGRADCDTNRYHGSLSSNRAGTNLTPGINCPAQTSSGSSDAGSASGAGTSGGMTPMTPSTNTRNPSTPATTNGNIGTGITAPQGTSNVTGTSNR